MKKAGILVAFFLIAVVNSRAQSYKMGLGIRFSTDDAVINNAVSFKYFFGASFAGEALLSFTDPGAFGVLLEKQKPLFSKRLQWFYGGGAYLGFSESKRLGLQGVVGIDYKLPIIPLNLSLDWKPELNLTRAVFFEAEAVGLSARFTFK